MQRSFGWLRTTFVPTIGVALVNVSALVICAGALTGLWMLVQPSPIERVETLLVEPANHVVDRSKGQSLTVVRRITMRREATLQVMRVWVDEAGGVTPTLDDYLHLEAGAHQRSRVRISPPFSLGQGRHRYRVALRACNALSRCHTYQLEDIEVLVLGEPPLNTDDRWQDHRF